MNGLTQGLLPVEVLSVGGKRPSGELLYQVNRTKEGYVVLLMNNRGVDKTPNGVARVDRRQAVEVVLRASVPVKESIEFTGGDKKNLKVESGTEVRVMVAPGDVRVIGFVVR
jgi:hypothetical protein